MLNVIQEVIPPAVTRELAKQHLKITHTSEDTLIDSYIAHATQFVEAYSGLRLIQREIRLQAVLWKSWYKLPRPLVNVVSAHANGEEIALDKLLYQFDGRLFWPNAVIGPYYLTLTAGVVDDVAKLPPQYQGAVLAAVGFLYNNREGQEWPAGLQSQIRALGGVRL